MPEQIPLIEASALPVDIPRIAPTDLFLLIAWVPYRSTVPPFELRPQTRAKIECFDDLGAAQREASNLAVVWTGRCIAHVVIGGSDGVA